MTRSSSPPTAHPVYGLDIETDTTADGLDPAVAPIIAVAVATSDGDYVIDGDEVALLARLDRLLARLPPGVLVTWYGSGFDLPFIDARAHSLGPQWSVVGMAIATSTPTGSTATTCDDIWMCRAH
jgi:DNA polymerase elongation subunit (family B)